MLEVIVAIAILSVTTTILMRFLVTGDRLYSRSLLVKNAALLAQSEAELLKTEGPLLEEIESREYEEIIGKRTFNVARRVIEADSLDSLISHYSLREIDLEVLDPVRPEKPLARFKMLQGFNIR